MFSVSFLRCSKSLGNFLKKGHSFYLQPTPYTSVGNVRYSFHSIIGKSIFTPPKIFRASNSVLKPLVGNISTEVTVKPKQIVGYWLLGCCGMVVVAVVLGGITRLTESGLSMVTWRILGEKIPWTEEEWNDEFKRYQQYPEYRLLKRDITIDEFKWIWKMEFAHRSWGRLIGAAFYIPAAVFWARGYLTHAIKKRVLVFGSLIAIQGLMGWYMVKSGLEDRFHEQTDIPRVSQYRLAAHLGLAFTLYTAMLYSAFSILLPLQEMSGSVKNSKYLRRMAYFSKGLIFLTAISGAFVAGLDAGLVYNSFPKMGDKWIPDDILAFSPKLINFTENPTTVQFDHRILGLSTMGTITGLWLLSRGCPLPSRAKTAVNALACMGLVQVLLGVSTLVHYVPTHLAAIHQSGSLLLLSFAVWLAHELKYVKYVTK